MNTTITVLLPLKTGSRKLVVTSDGTHMTGDEEACRMVLTAAFEQGTDHILLSPAHPPIKAGIDTPESFVATTIIATGDHHPQVQGDQPDWGKLPPSVDV